MRHLSVVLALVSLTGAATAVLADPIPYPNAGTIAAPVTLVATQTGDITGYFVGQSAGDDSVIRLVNVTSGYVSDYFFANHATAVGTTANFGTVHAGDTLVFELLNQSKGLTFATDPGYSEDGLNHGYAAAFSGGLLDGVNFPTGIYIGMEDLPGGGDLDYNDNTFLFTNVNISRGAPPAPAPEPGSFVLLGTGILGVAGTLRRKMFAR